MIRIAAIASAGLLSATLCFVSMLMACWSDAHRVWYSFAIFLFSSCAGIVFGVITLVLVCRLGEILLPYLSEKKVLK